VTASPAKVREILTWLERRGSKRAREEMLTRYGITAPKAFGVKVSDIRLLAKRLGRDHELAAGLWETGWYEARMLTSFVDDPARVTPAQPVQRCGGSSRRAAPSNHDDQGRSPMTGTRKAGEFCWINMLTPRPTEACAFYAITYVR
jgi:DNA alkylation repair enzyme